MSSFVQNRILSPVKALLNQGLNPDALALCLSVGFVLGFFPVFGITTLLCVLAAGVLRLNQVAIQIANYCGYPLQFILFIPFIRLGEYLFGLKRISVNPVDIFTLAKNNFSLFLEQYGLAISAACAAWLLVALPVVLVLWKGLAVLLKAKMKPV
ncbi:DUF2062 domain-containing protein [Endozoicomonas montiporae]|uniref:DUF2062 domain-containing protein n=1 Tax=Endozoicomonas montiporae CL-33 TaxID=570277 RepID=A0A142B7X1_9GAMM|nr:DUF2062 domain-containing protein [Endozoicomonas montiporae]AMO54847.1 hypothetical protein EZMO1_0605 [Endozoicomonas montiporae CL-33]